MIGEWLGRKKRRDLGRDFPANGNAGSLRKVPAVFSTPITVRCSFENLAWAAVAIGVMLRLVEYVDYRDIYMDELSLLHNLTGLGVFDFHTTLAEDQLAPPGFLIVARMLVRLPLNRVLAARFLSLVCGIGSVVLMRLVARQYLSRPAVPIAVGLFALSDWLIYYSAEIKQYMADVALTLATLFLTAMLKPAARLEPDPQMDRATANSRQWNLLALAVFGTVGVWFSFPLAFVLGGAGSYVIASAALRRDWQTARRALLMSIIWAASFAACFRVSHAIMTRGQFIWMWWDFAFLPLPPRSAADLERVFWQLLNVFNSPSDVLTPLGVLPSAFLALGLFLVGALALGRNWAGGLYLTLSPIAFALLASALRQYPFHGRLVLFLVPLVHLPVAQGAASLAQVGYRLVRGLAAGLPARAWSRYVLACIAALIAVSPVFLLCQPAAVIGWRYAITRNRVRPFDSHGDLRNDLLDYREHMARKARGQ